MTSLEWRGRQFLCSLSREQRQAVANRSRFYSMPYLRRSDEPDDDTLP